jgi:hypothetical protein
MVRTYPLTPLERGKMVGQAHRDMINNCHFERAAGIAGAMERREILLLMLSSSLFLSNKIYLR